MILVFLPSLDFTVAFLACLIAGLIPVPVFPPDPRRLNKDLNMFTSIQVKEEKGWKGGREGEKEGGHMKGDVTIF